MKFCCREISLKLAIRTDANWEFPYQMTCKLLYKLNASLRGKKLLAKTSDEVEQTSFFPFKRLAKCLSSYFHR